MNLQSSGGMRRENEDVCPVVVPAQAGTHTPRPAEGAQGETACFNNCVLGLWVPACAGTTAECLASLGAIHANVASTSPNPSSSIRT